MERNFLLTKRLTRNFVPPTVEELIKQQAEFMRWLEYTVRHGNSRQLQRVFNFRQRVDPASYLNMYGVANSARENQLHVYQNNRTDNQCGASECPLGDSGETCGCGTTVINGYSCMNATYCLVNTNIFAYVTFEVGYVINNMASESNANCSFDGNYYGNNSCADGAMVQMMALTYFDGTVFHDTTNNIDYTIQDFISQGPYSLYTNPDDLPGYIEITNLGAVAKNCYVQSNNPMDVTSSVPFESVYYTKYSNCDKDDVIPTQYGPGPVNFAGFPTGSCPITSTLCPDVILANCECLEKCAEKPLNEQEQCWCNCAV